MSKTDPLTSRDFSGEMFTTMLYTSMKLDDASALWMDATAVKEAVERLDDVHLDYFRPLDEVREQLTINPARHMEFLEFGGATALRELLKMGNSVIQRKCMRAIEVLVHNEDPRKQLRDMGIGDSLLDIIRASSRRPESTRRAKAGEILKLLAGSSGSAVVFQHPVSQLSRKRKPSRRFTKKLEFPSKLCLHRPGEERERPYPFWYFTTNPILPWDAETAASLVDILLSDAVESSQDCAHRIIRKILSVGQLTRHVVIDSADISDLIRVIHSMHSTSIHAVKAVTFASIMHSSNGVTFIQRGGLEALVSSLKSDNMGSICGELSAWALSHFCKTTSAESTKRVISAGGIEGLVELSHSTDTCSREAAVYGIMTLLRHCEKQKKLALRRLGEAHAIPSLLRILQEHKDSKNQAVVLNVLWILLQLARHAIHRTEIRDLYGVRIVHRSIQDADRPIKDVGNRLQKLLITKTQRSRSHKLSVVWKSSNKKKNNFRSKIVHSLKRVIFGNETSRSSTYSRGSRDSQDSTILQTTDIATEHRRRIPERSMSSLSSSVYSDYCEGLLATAPEGPTGFTLDELFANNSSPRFQTYTMQPYEMKGAFEKDFDPFIFGGRPLVLSKVEEHDRIFGTQNSKDTAGGHVNPELITSHDFL